MKKQKAFRNLFLPEDSCNESLKIDAQATKINLPFDRFQSTAKASTCIQISREPPASPLISPCKHRF